MIRSFTDPLGVTAPAVRLAPAIAGTGTSFPAHRYSQEEILGELARLWRDRGLATGRLELLHRNVQVKERNLALPLADYAKVDTFAKRNDVFTRLAVDLGEQAVRQALEAAGLSGSEVGHVFFTTVTGIAAPSIDARLVGRLGLPAAVKRTPMFGLGCVAGAAGVARAADYLRAFPDEVAVLLAVELCSLTFQEKDATVANMIATGLFGDGAAAVVLTGANRVGRSESQRAAPRVVASRSIFYPDTQDVMGWEVVETGFRVLLTGQVPDLVRDNVRRDVDALLASLGLERRDIRHWIAHTGGPKVLEAFEAALELDRARLARSWRSLEAQGNLSSASVLLVLDDTLAHEEPRPGDLGLMMAMGPGFCAELVVLQW